MANLSKHFSYLLIQVMLSEYVQVFEATKGLRWMPWHQKATKDVVSCDKPREVAHTFLSEDFRMGKPTSISGTTR